MWKYLVAVAIVAIVIIIAIIAYAVSAGHIDSSVFGLDSAGDSSQTLPPGNTTLPPGTTLPPPTPTPDPAETDDSTPYEPTPAGSGVPSNTNTLPVQVNPLDKFVVTTGTAMPGNNAEMIYTGMGTPQDCAKACLEYDGCRSFDYRIPTATVGGGCHLSTKTTADVALYKTYPGWDYYELSQ